MVQDPDTMKSPITGGNVTLQWEFRKMVFRGESYRVFFLYYKCVDSGEQFTTTELDRVWYEDLLDKYCERHGISRDELDKEL